jgi:DNA-directed RNA polymerase specialized sigma24 family protein
MSVHQQSFRSLYETYAPRLLNSMTAVVRNREAAEDITSEALAKAFEHLARRRPDLCRNWRMLDGWRLAS